MRCVFNNSVHCVLQAKATRRHANVSYDVDLMRSRHLIICVIVFVPIISHWHTQSYTFLHCIHLAHVTCHLSIVSDMLPNETTKRGNMLFILWYFACTYYCC